MKILPITLWMLLLGSLLWLPAHAQRLDMEPVYGNYAVNFEDNGHLLQTRLGTSVMQQLKEDNPVLVVYHADGGNYIARYNMDKDDKNAVWVLPLTPGLNNTFTFEESWQIEDTQGVVTTERRAYTATYDNGQLRVQNFAMGRDVIFYAYE
ncbi:MAG: hypothetical protein KF690_10495 [Bacteroidetes bacterium]|nr:hypothetical protein [Bacteroidota bacterium]